MSDIDAIHLHATGTRANDKSEAIGLGNAWAKHGDQTPPAFGSVMSMGAADGRSLGVEAGLAAVRLGECGAAAGCSRAWVTRRCFVRSMPCARAM